MRLLLDKNIGAVQISHVAAKLDVSCQLHIWSCCHCVLWKVSFCTRTFILRV